MNLINLTPHAIVLYPDNDPLPQIIPATSPAARVETLPGVCILPKSALGVPLYSMPGFGAVQNLPEPQSDTMYIVSLVVAQNASHRSDLIVPGTGPADNAVRDADGRILGITRFITLYQGSDR